MVQKTSLVCSGADLLRVCNLTSCSGNVDASEDGDDPEKLIKKNFKVIFEEELAGWYTDEEAWPKKMDLRVFKQWFHVKVHEIVVDIGKKLPIAEEY